MPRTANLKQTKLRARRKRKLDDKAVETALRETHGNLAAVARRFDVARASVWKFCQRRKLQQVLKDCREGMLDHAETALYSAVMNKEAWAVRYLLNCQGKGRGYVERVQHEHLEEERVTLEVVEHIVDGGTVADGVHYPPGAYPPDAAPNAPPAA
jgi:hypothetical protein